MSNPVPNVGGIPLKAVDLAEIAREKAKLAEKQKATAMDVKHSALIVDADGAVEFLEKHPGWHIFPGRIVREGARWMKLPAKGLSWTTAASADPDSVRTLWELHGTPVPELGGPRMACVAVHVGKSGLVVLDQDQELAPIEGEMADRWRAALATKAAETLTLRSCTRGMPHFIYRQRDGQLISIQDWVAGEVKSRNGYIFISTLDPLADCEVKVIPDEISNLLVSTSVVEGDGTDVVKLDDRDLEIWLATTDCRLEPSQEAGLIKKLVTHLVEEAESGHRRDAMRAACMTLAIEATAGLYSAQAAWDALEDAYQDIRNDPGRNAGNKAKEWSSFWWRDSRVLLAGAVEKVEAGRFDDAIDEKRLRFGIMSDSEEDALKSWFEAVEESSELALPRTSAATEPPSETVSETPQEDQMSEPPFEGSRDPRNDSGTQSEAPKKASEAEHEQSDDPNNIVADTGLNLDPNERLRELAAGRGINLDHVLGALEATVKQRTADAETNPVREALRISKKVNEQLERDLVRQIAHSISTKPVEAESWDWLMSGGIDALVNKAPGTMLFRSDGEGLIYDRGCVHFIGDKSTGKSWLCAALAVERMREGEHVAWLDYETDQQQLAERLLQAGATLEELVTQLHYFSMKGEPIGGAVEAIGLLDPLPTCMIVDSVDASMAHSGADDENSSSGYHAWRAAIAPLTEVMVTVLIEHTGHENAHRARGASAKGQQADQEFSAKVIKPFSKETAGLVEWTCRKNRRGGSFTTDDVAAFVSIEPAGRVYHNGEATKLDNAVRLRVLSPSKTLVENSAIAGAAIKFTHKEDEIFTWMKIQPRAWTMHEAFEGMKKSCTKNDVIAAVEEGEATGRLRRIKTGEKSADKFLWTGSA